MVQIGKVEHFQSGKDWESYEQCLQQYLYKITDVDQKFAVFLTVIGRYLYKLLHNLVSLSKPSEKSYNKLNTVLKQHLVPKPIAIAEKPKFCKHIQQPGKNIATYLASLKQFGETCDCKAFLNEALKDHLVCVVS